MCSLTQWLIRGHHAVRISHCLCASTRNHNGTLNITCRERKITAEFQRTMIYHSFYSYGQSVESCNAINVPFVEGPTHPKAAAEAHPPVGPRVRGDAKSNLCAKGSKRGHLCCGGDPVPATGRRWLDPESGFVLSPQK